MPHRRWPEERRESSFGVRARRQRLAGMAGIGSLVAITGYLVGGGVDGAAVGTSTSATDSVSATSVTSVASVIAADTTSATETAPAASTAVGEAALACATTYTVVAGDSWYGIADAASVEVSALYGLNAAGDATMLFPGDSICLPDGTVVTTTTPMVTTVAAQASASSASANAVAAVPSGQPASSSHGS